MFNLIEKTRERQRTAREDAYATPLSKFHPGNPEFFRTDTLWPYFERLRQEEPVHFCSTSPVGNYWSVTKYSDIIRVETNAAIFSSDLKHGGIMLRDVESEYQWPSFITMDAPKHGPQRKTVSSMFSPEHLNKLAVLIRERSAEILDGLPRNEPFNWVDRVSVELTTQMLATLFAFPWEDHRKLTRWSDLATALPKSMIYENEEQRLSELAECRDYFTRLWNERVNAEPQCDLIAMMAHAGNRDSEVIADADRFIIDRARPRSHLSFGFGIHRCVGMRLAELQLKIIWEEILKRYDNIEVVAEPRRVYSSFVKGYVTLPVRINA